MESLQRAFDHMQIYLNLIDSSIFNPRGPSFIAMQGASPLSGNNYFHVRANHRPKIQNPLGVIYDAIQIFDY